MNEYRAEFWLQKRSARVLCAALAQIKKIFNESVVLQERESLARHQMLEEERRRREEAEKRLQDETFHRQQLVEKEVKMRSKNFSQVSEMRHNCVCMVEMWKRTWQGFTHMGF